MVADKAQGQVCIGAVTDTKGKPGREGENRQGQGLQKWQ